MLTIDYATTAARSILMDKARAAIVARRWTGRPGDGWVIDNTGFPKTFGAVGEASLFANADGTGYAVHLHDDAGNKVGHQEWKTLDAAFNGGKRMVRAARR
ncbi:hypothetical protein TPA0907_55920 [Micromonospora humidisoli]|uniref:hypothetical protein n=1 Tax=Micromonospora sp. AKA109 TaxID=2733865 RepID=UPI0022C6FC0C|nr:hypothetical protein [Micromonospora sp. AKA109]GHJ11225.1 hypothetical protein TPA0907_55920 [Micromonospora sp. AKA109]